MANGQDFQDVDLADQVNSVVRAGLNGRKVTLLLVGPAGAGKSTLANTLLMRPIFKTGISAKAVTKNVIIKREQIELEDGGRVDVEIIDTPGLSGKAAEDRETIRQLHSIDSPIDAILICFDMRGNSSRFLPMLHEPVLDTLSKIFGQQISDGKAVICLTKGNLVSPNKPIASGQAAAGSHSAVKYAGDWKSDFRYDMDEDDCFSHVNVLPVGCLNFRRGKPFSVSPVDGEGGWLEKVWNEVANADTSEMPVLSALLYALAAESRRDREVPENVVPRPNNSFLKKILLFALGSLAVGAAAGVVAGAALVTALPVAAATILTAPAAAAVSLAASIVSGLRSFWGN